MIDQLPGPELRRILSYVFILFGVLNLLMALLSIHLICHHTPRKFGHYKWIQLLITVSIFYSDLWGVLGSAIFIPKTFGAIIVSQFSCGSLCTSVWLSLLADGIMLQFSAKVLAFYYRIFIMLPLRKQELFRKLHFIAFAFIFSSIHVMPVAIFLQVAPNQTEFFEKLMFTRPWMAELVNIPEPIIFYNIGHPAGLWLFRYLLLMGAVFAPCFLYALFCIYKYLVKSQSISTKTRQMQMKLLYSLTVQFVVPLIICILPYITVVMSTLGHGFYLPYVTPYTNLLCCTHTMLNTFILVWFTKPYYERCVDLLMCRRSASTTEISPTRASASAW